MGELPSGTVTFLFTDIEGSTRLLQQLGDAYSQALGEHQALLRAAFAAYDGVEVDTTGDSFFVAFASAPQALAAAAEVTRALDEHVWPRGTEVRVRMGLHTGAPQLAGDHYIGLDVHRGARIAAAGHGGQILLSQATGALSEQALPDGASLRDLGAHRLKDLQQPEWLYQLVLPGLPANFPPLKTLDTHQHNLPIQPTPLLDRTEHLAALSALLRRDDARLVTLTGPGGIGKTRLAVQVAAELIEAFPDGAWFVRLSRLTDPNLVIPTIAQTLGLKETSDQSFAQTLQAYVASKRLLFVLDNFEQVMGAAGDVATLLEAGPELKALVTSRAPLRLRGEKVYATPPLPLAEPGHPPSLEQLSQYAAMALFIERARDARSDFAVTAANAPAIGEMCARLDGLPLAIELAAARVRLLPPEALLARLSTQLKLLTGGARDVEERQRTMQATMAWSEDLLTAEERMLFRRLAVFVGGCTLEAAEAVCAAPAGAEPLRLDVLEGLSGLVDQSLVQQREEGGEPHFGMLHVVREYALTRLEASGEAETLRRAHAETYLALAEQADSQIRGPEAGVWVERLAREHDNLRAALGWAEERRELEIGLRLIASTFRLWDSRGVLREGRAWADRLLAMEAPSQDALASTRAAALVTAGRMAQWQGDYATAKLWLEQAATLGQDATDLFTASRATLSLGLMTMQQGDMEQAKAYYEQSLALGRASGSQVMVASALNNLGDVLVYQDDLEQAREHYTEALTLMRQTGHRLNLAVCLANLGSLARRQGDMVEAEKLGREGLALSRELGQLRDCAGGLEQLAITAVIAGEGARAARLLGAAAALRATIGAPQPPSEREEMERDLVAARAALGEERWAAGFAEGQALSLDEAIAEALGSKA